MSADSPSWYIPSKGKQPAGPFTAEQIIESWREGRLDANTVCWREGMAQWLPLRQIEPFASAIASASVPRKSTPGAQSHAPPTGATPSTSPGNRTVTGPRATSLWVGLMIAGGIGAIGIVVVGLVLLVNAPWDPNARVLAQARHEIEAKLLHLNGSWYGYEMNPFGGLPMQLVEMKGLSVKAEQSQVDAADKANEIEWRGTIRIECEIYRTVSVTTERESNAVRIVGKWGEWRDGGRKDTPLGKMGGVRVFAVDPFMFASPALNLTIRKGQWEWCVKGAQKPDPGIIPKD